jgi:hypothetical protein
MFKTSKEDLQETLQQLDQALYYHEQWLTELTRTIICRLPYDPANVAVDAHRHCRFGKWCYDKPPQSLREHPSFVAMSIEHQRMHQLGARVILASEHQMSGLSKDYDCFKNSLERLRLEIDTLKREIEDSMYNAYSGRFRPAFRFDCDRDSEMIATGIPTLIRPRFRSNPTG